VIDGEYDDVCSLILKNIYIYTHDTVRVDTSALWHWTMSHHDFM